MQAAVLHARSGAGQLVFKETPMRCLLPTEVRIRVLAAGLPPTELTCNSTQRTGNGHKRLPIILGQDVAGIVDAVGTGVSDWAIDDEVYGLVDFTSDGSAAQYVNARAADIAAKPKSLDFLHAATVPRGALTAWQALFDHGDLHPRQTVLIHGADGGVGAYAVQLARFYGAKVIATASAHHIDFVRKLGASVAIDYTNTQFETIAKDVSVVLDTIGGQTRERSWKVLKPGGTLISITSPIAADSSRRGDVNGVFFIVQPDRSQLTDIAALIDSGQIRPFVEDSYPLCQAQKASSARSPRS
jgi:NADPH:quinone reductase-like Zn-dependent oxidoreductase